MMVWGKILPGRKSKKLRMCVDQNGGHLAGLSEARREQYRGPAAEMKHLGIGSGGGKATEES